MTRHTDVLRNLYDYLRDELPAAERERVREHLAGCPDCTRACEEIGATISALEPLQNSPAGERPDSYWEEFLETTLDAVRNDPVAVASPAVGWWGELTALLTVRHRWIVVTGGAAIAIGLFMILAPQRVPDQADAPPPAASTPVVPAETNLDAYLRKSTSLLVSLTNGAASEQPASDFALERAASRELAREAEFLDGEAVDPRSARVINDLQKVFIELANLDESSSQPDMDIVLHGIREHNLLFRVRMAEAFRDSVRVLQTAMMDQRE
jgi:anti-sigma factor RsiW